MLAQSGLCSGFSGCSKVVFTFEAFNPGENDPFRSCQAGSGSGEFVSDSRQQRSQNKASVTAQSGLQARWRISLPGQRKNGLFSVVSSTFYPLREALKSLTFLQLLSSFTSAHSSIVSLSTF